MHDASQHPRKRRIAPPNPWADFAPLLPAERALISCAARGEGCDLLARFPDCEDCRVVRPALFRALCLRAGAVDPKGIYLVGAVFCDELNLRDTNLSFGLEFVRCTFQQGVDVNGAALRYLGFYSSTVHEWLRAWSLQTEYGLALTSASDGEPLPFVAHGPVYLNSAKVGGQLYCEDAHFNHEGDECFYAQGMDVGQGVFLSGVVAAGPVDLNGAKVGGQLDCEGAHFNYKGDKCFYAQGMDVGQSVSLRGVVAAGPVDLSSAKVGGQLDCKGAKFYYDVSLYSKDDPCLAAFNIEIERNIFLSNVVALGPVNLNSAKVGGQLDCEGAKFNYEGDRCFSAQALEAAHIFLRNVVALGPVDLNSAKVGGQLACEGAKFKSLGTSLQLYCSEVVGDVYLSGGFEAEGYVSLVGAELRGSLYCEGGLFRGWQALGLQQANIADRFRWKPMEVGRMEGFGGLIDLTNAHVGVLEDGYALTPPSHSFRERLRYWWEDRRTEFGCGLYSPRDPCKQRYRLDGFTYDSLAREMSKNGSELVRWLLLSDGGEYHPQPFEQMAKVLRESGHDAEAREVAIGKRIQRRRSLGGFPLWRKLRQFLEFWLLDIPIRYGYRPWVAIVFAVVIWGFAAFQFERAYDAGVMVPASQDALPNIAQKRDARFVADRLKEQKARWQRAALPKGQKRPTPDWAKREQTIAQTADQIPETEKPKLKDFVPAGYPRFSAPIYALDEFLPIIELHQVEYWIPDDKRPGGGWYWGLLWFVCISGWYLSTLFVSAFTGLIKSE